MAYREFSDSDYTQMRKELIKNKGGDLQRDFLEATRENDTFITWVETRISLENAGEAFDLWAERMSEGEYKEPPKSAERALFEKWDKITPAQASQETFWGHVTLEHIRQGIIDASYLAANGGNLPGGLERIDKALADTTEAQNNRIDSIVRTILRRLGGLPEARGSRSVYVNCPFARAWWRVYLTNQVCDETGADSNKVLKTLTKSQEYWEGFINLIVSRNSVLGDSKVRTALIWALSELVNDKSKEGLFHAKTIKSVSKIIGIRSAWQELGVFETPDLKSLIETEIIATV